MARPHSVRVKISGVQTVFPSGRMASVAKPSMVKPVPNCSTFKVRVQFVAGLPSPKSVMVPLHCAYGP